jgi:general secretion pathway protein K
VQSGKINEPSRLAFARLFDLLDLPASELAVMLDQLRLAQGVGTDPAVNATVPLWPEELDQLIWLGLSAATVSRLQPYVTVLPVPTPVNLNTASAEVVYACVEAFELADANRLLRSRNTAHLTSIADASRAGGVATAQFNEAQHSVATRFFEVRGKLQVEQTTVQEQSVVQRDGLDVKLLWRKRGVLPAQAPLQY